jgi:putative ABC transport system permease protein
VLVLLREISFRHWMRARLRSGLIVIGIALGVGLYVATEAAIDSMYSAFDDMVQRIAGRADLCIQGTGGGVPGDVVGRVSEVPGVEHVAASLEITAQVPDYGETLLILGVDLLGDLHFLPFNVQSGERSAIADPLSFVNDAHAILLSRRFAERHGLKQGSELRLLTAEGPQAFHVRGVLEDRGAAGSFGGQVAVMFLDAAQVSFSRGMFVDRVDIAIAKKPGTKLEDVRAAVTAALGGEHEVELPQQVGSRLRALTASLDMGLSVSGFLSVVVGSFLVYNAVAVAVAQRRREVGILRALGGTRAGMIWLFMCEAALLAIPGSIIGIVIGRLLAHVSVSSTLETLDSLFVSASQIAPKLQTSLVRRAMTAGVVMALISAFFPARSGTAFDPAIVLRGASSVELKRPPVRAMLILSVLIGSLLFVPFMTGTALGGIFQLCVTVLAAALATPAFVVAMRAVFVPLAELCLGMPGRLGLDYVERTLSRSTINVLALMVAVGMSFSVSSWLGSFEHSLSRWADQVGTADLTVTRGSPVLDRRHVPLVPGAVEQVRAVPGVQDVQRYRLVHQEVNEVRLRLVATDMDVFVKQAQARGKGWEIVQGAPLAPNDINGRSVVLSENAARLLRVTAGDLLQVMTPKQGNVTLSVRAVVVDFTSETGTAFLDLRFFHERWNDETVDGLFVYADPKRSLDQLADDIRAALTAGERDATLFVTKTSSVQQHLLGIVRKAFSYSSAVEIMTLMIGLLGVIGTMIAAVMDRQRELGMLRAVGATREQVATAIVIEAGFLGLCAAIAGILVGVMETFVFFRTLVATETGWHLQFIFPWVSALRTTGLVVLTSALAGLVPAYRALRHEVVAAAGGE